MGGGRHRVDDDAFAIGSDLPGDGADGEDLADRWEVFHVGEENHPASHMISTPPLPGTPTVDGLPAAVHRGVAQGGRLIGGEGETVAGCEHESVET